MGQTALTARHVTYLSSAGRLERYVVEVVLASIDRCVSVDGGIVTVNGTALPVTGGMTGPVYTRRDESAANSPLRFDGTMERFSISGSTKFPALVDSIRSFSGVVEISSPGPLDTISRDSDLEIVWNASPIASDSVEIWVSDSASLGRPGKFLQYRVGDNGSHIVPGTDLGRFPGGPVIVYIQRIRAHDRLLAGDRPYTVRLESIFNLVTTLR